MAPGAPIRATGVLMVSMTVTAAEAEQPLRLLATVNS